MIKLLNESLKLVALVFSIVVYIYISEKHNQKTGNQFLLNDQDKIYHGKNYSNDEGSLSKKTCLLYPKELMGNFDVNIYNVPTLNQLKSSIHNLEPGGFHKPKYCVQREKLAIIIPYRDRENDLMLLMKYLHPFLQRQSRYYRIFLVEQFGNDIFNKGRIMNIAAKEARKVDDFDCFIFHDVDLIPENDENIYECYSHPRHLCPAVDELRYNLMYYNLVGGVLALNNDHLDKTNGYSNLYWGWGAEDDDMSMRIIGNGFKITRPTNKVGRYKMMLHQKRVRAENRFELLEYWKRFKTDGISSLDKLKYTIKSIQYSFLYTNITVDIGSSTQEKIDTNEIERTNFKFH